MNYDFNSLIYNYIQKFGNSALTGHLNPKCKFFISSREGTICYRDELNCFVVIGDPICSSDNKIFFAKEFYEFAKKNNKKIIYILLSQDFTNQILDIFGGAAIQFGHEIILSTDIDIHNLAGYTYRRLRQKYNTACSKNLMFKEYIGNNLEIEKEFINISKFWLSKRKSLQVYLLPLDIFYQREYKRYFYVEKDNIILGFLMLNRLDSLNSWVLNGSVMLLDKAPKSSSEFLILKTLDLLKNENCKYFLVGPTVYSKIEKIIGFNVFWSIVINLIMTILRKIFKLNDRQRYWKKFQAIKKPSFIIFNSSYVSLKEIRSILRVFHINI